MQKYKESETRRKQRIEHIKCLRTRVVESKKTYNRNKIKQELRRHAS